MIPIAGSVGSVKIGVTGATGGVGSRVVRRLLTRHDPPAVVALARRPDGVPAPARSAARRADYDEPASLRVAFVGIETLVFVSSDGEAEVMRRHHEHVVDAAIEAGVGHVVYTSILDVATDSRFYYSPIHRETEARLVDSNLRHCFARTSIFDDFLVETWIVPALGTGTLSLSTGEGRMSLITREDTARAVAAAATTGLEGVIELTGPEALTAEKMAQIAEVEIGWPLRHEDLDDETYRRRLDAQNERPWLIEAYASMFTSVREGRFETVSADVVRLTGREPASYADFLRSASLEPA